MLDRLALDPLFGIRLAVLNNPVDTLTNFKRSYAFQGNITADQLVVKLQNLWKHGYEKAVNQILDIPWIRGTHAILDEAMDRGTAELDETEHGEAREKFIQFVAPALMAITNAIGNIGAGRRAEQAAAAEQQRIAAMAAAQAQADDAKAARQQQWFKWGGIALATIAVLVLAVWFIRKQ